MILLVSCQYKNDKKNIESDESQILNFAFDKVIGSDTTYRFWLRYNSPPIPFIAFTNKIDSVEYLKEIHWHDCILKILDTASLYVVVNRPHAYMVEFYINNLRDSIRLKKGDTLFDGVLKILCDQNWSKDTTNITLLKPKYNFTIYNDTIAPFDRIRNIGAIHFSKIAFNTLKDTACVYTSFSRGEFSGSGEIHFIVKKENKWIFCKTFILWSS